MKFTPMTDTEIDEMRLIPDGTYAYIVTKAIDRDNNGNPLLTKSGVDKIQITLSLQGRLLDCTLTSSFPKLLKHFCDVSGLSDKYKTGELTAHDCLNKRGLVVVGHREYYSDKLKKMVKANQVEDFTTEQRVVGTTDGFSDEIPF
jgi:hypothetical protein